MFFLCNPLSFEDVGVGWLAVFIVIVFFSFIWNPIFLGISYIMEKKGLIRKFIVEKIMNEFSWIWGILAFVAVKVPSATGLLFIPILISILFPLYFTLSFIILIIKKDLVTKNILLKIEKSFLTIYYGGISILIIILGMIFKLNLYGNFTNLAYYYTQDIGKKWFVFIFLLIILMFIVFWYKSEKWITDTKSLPSKIANTKIGK